MVIHVYIDLEAAGRFGPVFSGALLAVEQIVTAEKCQIRFVEMLYSGYNPRESEFTGDTKVFWQAHRDVLEKLGELANCKSEREFANHMQSHWKHLCICHNTEQVNLQLNSDNPAFDIGLLNHCFAVHCGGNAIPLTYQLVRYLKFPEGGAAPMTVWNDQYVGSCAFDDQREILTRIAPNAPLCECELVGFPEDMLQSDPHDPRFDCLGMAKKHNEVMQVEMYLLKQQQQCY